MRIVWVVIAAIMLSGCFGGGPSKSEMEADAVAAIQHFRGAVLPDGDLHTIAVSGQVSMESEVNGFPVTVTLNPEMDVTLGAAGDIHIVGSALALDFEAYCHPDHVVAITEGGKDYGVPDMSVEARNPLGFCTGPGSEQLLLPFFEFELIDPSLLTGDLDLDEMVPVGFDDLDGAIAATYEVTGAKGTTTLTFEVKDKKVQQIVSSNDDGNLVLDMSYGDRTALAAPDADDRVGNAVRGSHTITDDGWSWEGRSDAGPIEDFRLEVFEEGTSVPCSGGPTPVVAFDLKEGTQNKDGWRLTLTDNGDGRLGDQDRIQLRHPNSEVSQFSHSVVFRDTWADVKASTSCTIPGIGAWAIAPLGLIALFARRP